MEFLLIVKMAVLFCAVINLPRFWMELRENKRKTQKKFCVCPEELHGKGF